MTMSFFFQDDNVLVGLLVGWLFGFYGIPTFEGFFKCQIHSYQCYFKQFSLAWVHSLIVKNISISSYSVLSNISN